MLPFKYEMGTSVPGALANPCARHFNDRLSLAQQAEKPGHDLQSGIAADAQSGVIDRHSVGMQMLGVAAAALVVRLLFALAASNTYDFDEFVILLLGRDFAHGSVPYRDFTFFHPPMILLIFHVLNPVIALWWPLARVLMACVDAATASLLWLIGYKMYGRRGAWTSAILYVLHPLALVSAVRVGQDPLVTLFVSGAIAILIVGHGSWRGLAAGALFGTAVMTKLPALLIAPVLVLAAPRQLVKTFLGFAGLALVCLAPFHAEWHQIYFDTVTFQRTRWTMNSTQRVETALIFWLLVNPLVVMGLIKPPRHWWLVAGWLLGAVFLLGSQVYYHYYTPFVPFACLLSGPVIANWGRKALMALVAGLCSLALAWAAWLNVGGSSPLYVTSAHLSDLSSAVVFIKHHSGPNDAILADRFEYAYLADRHVVAHYFWNVGVLVNASYLENRLSKTRLVVRSLGASSGYPTGFEEYVRKRSVARVSTADIIYALRPGVP